MSRGLLGVMLVAAGCAEETQPLTVEAPGADWIAVRTSEDRDWRRVDGPVARADTAGLAEVVVVCNAEVGSGWTWLVTPGDGGDDATIERPCNPDRDATPTFYVLGSSISRIYVGNQVAEAPLFQIRVAPGVHDVVAVQNNLDGERIQVLRDVEIVDGTRIGIDVDTFGQPPATATVTVNGERPWSVDYRGETASGTEFELAQGTGEVRTLPPALRVEGDRDLVYVDLDDGRWLDVEIAAGANDLTTDVPRVIPTFAAGDDAVTVTWSATDRWDRTWLRAASVNVKGLDYPLWYVLAESGAIDHHTHDGAVTLTLAPPDVDGWQPEWLPGLGGTYARTASWQRDRPDGCDGYVYGDFVEAP